MNNSSLESSSIISEVRKMLEMYFGSIGDTDNINVILSEQLEQNSKRIRALEEKNEKLYDKNDLLRERLDEMKEEVFRLRRILAENGIEYDNKK